MRPGQFIINIPLNLPRHPAMAPPGPMNEAVQLFRNKGGIPLSKAKSISAAVHRFFCRGKAAAPVAVIGNATSVVLVQVRKQNPGHLFRFDTRTQEVVMNLHAAPVSKPSPVSSNSTSREVTTTKGWISTSRLPGFFRGARPVGSKGTKAWSDQW